MSDQEQERTEKQQDAFTFMSLVTTYQQIAWVAMGKVANPTTGETERELEQARWAIDVLAMLERRTKGNLSDREERMLREMLHTLRMNYIEEVNKPPEPEKEDAGTEHKEAEPEPGKEKTESSNAGEASAAPESSPEERS